jgi:hypothetical protein
MKKEAQYQEVPVPMSELEAKYWELIEELDDAFIHVQLFREEQIKPNIKKIDEYERAQRGTAGNNPEAWAKYDEYAESDAGEINHKNKNKLEEMHDAFINMIDRARDEKIF